MKTNVKVHVDIVPEKAIFPLAAILFFEEYISQEGIEMS